MKITRCLFLGLVACHFSYAQWDATSVSNEVSTTDEIVAPVLRISNEIRVPNTFSPADPMIGTLDNTGFGINIHKTNGIGFAINNEHKFVFGANGNMVMNGNLTTTASDPKVWIRGTGTGNYQGASVVLAAEGVSAGKKHMSTWLMTHRGTDGTATFEMQRRDSNDDYNGSPLVYRDGYGWRFRVANTTTSDLSRGIMLTETGDIGMGTENPSAKLHVSTETSGDAVFRLEADTDNNNESDNPMIQLRQDGGQTGVNIGFSEEQMGSNLIAIGTRYANQDNWEVLSINPSNGNVGIGTKNAGNWKLAVKGKIRAEEIKVETGWADYVFREGYDLPSLEQVKRHIKEKGHLINIPSASEVKAHGIELGEMNKLLLEKIEELTLYTIQQEEKLEKMELLEREVSELKRMIIELQNQ